MNSRKLFGMVTLTGLLVISLLAGLVGRVQAAPVAKATLESTSARIDFGRSETTLTRPKLSIKQDPILFVGLPPPKPFLQETPVLTVTKTAEPDPALAGGVLTYTIVVAGDPITDVTGVVITDSLDSRVSYQAASDGGNHSDGVVTWTVDEIAAGQAITRTVSVTVSQVTSGTLLSNTAEVTSTEGASSTHTIATPVNAVADLSISKTNGQTQTVPGQVVTYTIAVSNSTGPSVVTGATVIDNFPTTLPDMTWICTASGGATCTAGGSSNIADTVDLPVGSSVTYVVSGTVSASATGQLTNTASVSTPAEVNDPNSGNNSATDTDTLTPQADLAISKTSNQLETVPGLTTTYTIVVSNSVGPSDISGAIVTDTFPFLTGVTWSCAGSAGGSCPADSGNGNLNHNVDLPVGSLVTFWVTGTVLADATGQLVNTAVVTVPAGAADPNSGNNSAADTDTLTPRADLAISKSNGQSAVVPGEQTTYTIIVTNTGPSVVTGATVLDAFPSLNDVTWNCTGSGGGECPAANGSGNLDDPVNLAVGSRVTFTATGTVDPAARGSLTNTATVTVPLGVTDPSLSNNSASDIDSLTPKADLLVTKSASPNPVIAGNILTYSLIVTNFGPSNATEVTLVDQLPSTGVTFVSVTPSQGSCSQGVSQVLCSLSTIPKNGVVTVTIQVSVDPSYQDLGLQNSASVYLAEEDPNGQNNSIQPPLFTQVIVRTDLAISKTDAADPTLLGNPLTYTLAITNYGPSNATGVVVTDTLPATVSLVSAQSTLGNCSGTGPVTCTLGAMNRGSTATVTIVVNPLQTGLLSNSANVAGNQTDPTAANNAVTESTQVNAEADLVVSMAGSPNPVFPGNNLTYNLTVVNKGPSPAVGTVVTATLPAGVSYVSATANPGSCSGTGPVSCNLGNLARNGTATATIVVKVGDATQGPLENSASVSSSRADPVPGNNSAPLNISVGQFKRVYLPMVFKPAPTELYVHNDNTGGNLTFIVRNYSTNAEVTRCIVTNGATIPCDHDNDGSNIFPPGLYKVEVFAVCGSDRFDRIYDSGRQTTRVFCR